ncbi:MAG: aspartate-semialdehyde dehydrogenase [Saprospiraceae bacterium]
MRVACVGATGLVGTVMCQVLEERNFPITDFIPVASEKSAGNKFTFKGKEYIIHSLAQAVAKKPDIALFSAGASVSTEWAPKFAEAGTIVVDNSSAWRMDPSKKLIVPEVNGNAITKEDRIIANPNCSTIQMVAALAPLHKAYGIKRLVISTYQSVTGTGVKAVKQYDRESTGEHVPNEEKAYKYPIYENVIPHCDVFLDNGYTKEEMKMVNETHKIMGDDSIRITATAVRVPVKGGHSESVNVEFEKEFDIDEIKSLLAASKGIELLDDLATFKYPMPLYAKGKNEVFVGRIRRDESQDKTLNMWIVADNLRKGAATNAIQIAEYMIEHELIPLEAMAV